MRRNWRAQAPTMRLRHEQARSKQEGSSGRCSPQHQPTGKGKVMRVLDLFSGIGGCSLGLERAGMRTSAFVEIDPYCRKVLARHWPGATIHHDIKQLNGADYAGTIDLICGGYP